MQRRAAIGAGLLLALVACSQSGGENLTLSALEGDFVAGGIVADTPLSAPRGDAVVMRFDGAGNATWPGVGKAFQGFRYSDLGNGELGLGDDVSGILGADGAVMVVGSRTGIFAPEFWGAVKATPGMHIGHWHGDYIGFAFGAEDGGPCWVRHVDMMPDGAGQVTWHEEGKSGEWTYEYGFRNGILTVIGSPVDTSDDHTTGAVSPDGNVVILTDLDPPDIGMVIGIKKSTPSLSSAWRGTYEGFLFGLEAPAGECATSRVTLTVDGLGRYTYRAVDAAGIVEEGAGTYVQKQDGTLTLDTGPVGIVSPDGDTVLLGLDSGGEMVLLFGVRR